MPEPEELGLNGTFNAFRILAQDASGFEDYLDVVADELLKDPNVDQLLAPGNERSIGEGSGSTRSVARNCGCTDVRTLAQRRAVRQFAGRAISRIRRISHQFRL